MSKAQAKALALISGVLAIIAAITDSSQKQSWEDVHTAAVIGGGILTVVGTLA